MASLLSDALPKFTAETLKLAAKQSERRHVVSDLLRRAIENYHREQELLNMRQKVLSLSRSFNGIKEANLLLPSSTSKELVEDPLKAMERTQRLKELPQIQSYDSLQSLIMDICKNKSGRKHDLVIASYVLGEIPSLKDRITHVCQLWDLTGDILPGTPQGSKIISQMRSHILWMDNRRTWKLKNAAKKTSKDIMTLKTGAFMVAPNTDKYCHFVQHLERTPSQRLYKWSKGPVRGFVMLHSDEEQDQGAWPLDGIKFETLKEMQANKTPENLEIDVESQFDSEESKGDEYEEDADEMASNNVKLSDAIA